jgi:hypothetical protein
MRSRDYTREIGVSSVRQRVPAAVAFVILGLVAVAGVWFVREVQGLQTAHAEPVAEPAAVKVSSR